MLSILKRLDEIEKRLDIIEGKDNFKYSKIDNNKNKNNEDEINKLKKLLGV